jgi:hypothetical protein
MAVVEEEAVEGEAVADTPLQDRPLALQEEVAVGVDQEVVPLGDLPRSQLLLEGIP